MTDMLGKIIFSETYNETQNVEIDVSSFAKGIYFVTVNNSVTKKIIKK